MARNFLSSQRIWKVKRRLCRGLVFTLVATALSISPCSCRARPTISPPTKPPRGPFHANSIRNWVQSRCGGDGSAVWVFHGSLYDPVDGRKIANVRGLELVRQLGEHRTSASDDPESQQRTFLEQCGDLKAPRVLLEQPRASINYVTTILSRKLFCYTSPTEPDTTYPNNLLKSIRLRPNAPLRKIPLDQTVALYDSAISLASRNQGRDLLVHTESPKGKCLWATATSSSSAINDESSFEFTIHTRRRAKQDVPNLSKMEASDTDGVTISPKRSSLVQFGGGGVSAKEQGRYGARETYMYTNGSKPVETSTKNLFQRLLGRLGQVAAAPSTPTARVRYTRYGEGPPWYGPGKFCTLDLQGRRVDNVQEVPPILSQFIAERLPTFWSVHGPLGRNDSGGDEAQRAVVEFRKGPIRWQVDDTTPAGGMAQQLAYRIRTRGSAVARRVRGASALSPTGSSSSL